jgi:AraC family transcriptional regulator
MEPFRVKNMVCDRCIQTVERIFQEEGYVIDDIRLGEVRVNEMSGSIDPYRLEWKLREAGFELLYDKNLQLATRIKAYLITQLGRIEAGEHNLKLSVYLSNEFAMSYQQISRTFSEVTGETIEKYFLNLKIERVKELLTYNELTLSEIAWKLGYSSVQHLSSQFKNVVGITVRDYKQQDNQDRASLDSI